MIKRILLGLGGSPYTSVAIRLAAELAKRFEAGVTGVTFSGKNMISP
ncbi:MAG: universal stress protein [Deltaproteobacteria bacterium]|nr:universal stress protein [Deltaproteobacteria bacterium]